MRHVVIAGVSTRAAAESAARAGFDVTAIDAFADADQHPAVRAISIPRPFTAQAAAVAANGIECDAAVYLSNFENHPEAVRTLGARRSLWGNPPDVLRRVRDPVCLSQALNRRDVATPRVHLISTDEGLHQGRWLVKPLASGGGHGVRSWHKGEPVPNGCYVQERIDGAPRSIACVGAQGRAAVLGVCRQLIGERSFGAIDYRYCGSIHTVHANPGLLRAVSTIATAVIDEFGLVGVNGIDFIERDGRPYVIEVNPRWTASMELFERAYDVSIFRLHALACVDRDLPPVDATPSHAQAGAIGKAIVFARESVTIGDTHAWLDDSSIRDVPHAGERIKVGQPVCTVFATGANEEECYALLVERAAAVFSQLAEW